jgi:hypothetical protein
VWRSRGHDESSGVGGLLGVKGYVMVSAADGPNRGKWWRRRSGLL